MTDGRRIGDHRGQELVIKLSPAGALLGDMLIIELGVQLFRFCLGDILSRTGIGHESGNEDLS